MSAKSACVIYDRQVRPLRYDENFGRGLEEGLWIL